VTQTPKSFALDQNERFVATGTVLLMRATITIGNDAAREFELENGQKLTNAGLTKERKACLLQA
jgi:hypothetical protein